MYLCCLFLKTIFVTSIVGRWMVSSFFAAKKEQRLALFPQMGVLVDFHEAEICMDGIFFHHHHWGFYHHPETTQFGVKSKNIDVIQLNFTHFLFHQGRGFVQRCPGDLSRTGGGSSHGYGIKVAGSTAKRAWRFWTHIVKNQVAALCTVWNSRIQKKVQLVKEKLSNKVEPVRVTMAAFRHSLEQIWYWRWIGLVPFAKGEGGEFANIITSQSNAFEQPQKSKPVSEIVQFCMCNLVLYGHASY